MHKYGFGQAYCKIILKRKPKKFILYFLSFIQLIMNFKVYMNF
jgi:hypothetical protein